VSITVADAQAVLDSWWASARPGELRVGRVAAFVAKRWNQADAGYVRVSIVDGADGLGTAIRIELETTTHVTIARELRPTTTRDDALTLDDVEFLGMTRRAQVGAS